MRVCLILEGSYPYVNGGVSSWAHQYIQAMPETEFVLWCVGAKAEDRDNFKYKLPSNVKEVIQVFLDDGIKPAGRKGLRVRIQPEEMEQLRSLLCAGEVEWDVLFRMCRRKGFNHMELLGSTGFLNIMDSLCSNQYAYMPYADFFHTVRSMLLPALFLLTTKVPEADIYHAAATGYSGLLGSLAAWMYKKPYVVTEHGIYTREREEELLRAKWIPEGFKKQWIGLFYQFSACAYKYADVVTALFGHANLIQQELGCSPDKTRVVPNGVCYEKLSCIPDKKPDGYVDIGAVVRIAKIKDIKTMLYAFLELRERFPNARLHIMGGVDDEEYMKECEELIEVNHITGVVFTGLVNIMEYMEKLDFTILTSISEGQPLSVLESLAARRPVVVTDVGCCRELVEGEPGDTFGSCGYCVPPMHKALLAHAMYRMCVDEKERRQMGVNGQKRVKAYYTHRLSMDCYERLYQEVLSGGNRI